MSRTIDIDRTLMPRYIGDATTFSTEDFFRKFPGEPAATIYSRIRRLIKQGFIHRIGRGRYAVGRAKEFIPVIDGEYKCLQADIKEEFPYSDMIIWSLSSINVLLQHMVNINLTIIDIDRDSVESLYWLLKGKGYNVITRKRMFDGLSEYDGFIFIRPLVTSAPKAEVDGVHSAAMEKILVDIACDKEFETFRGSELTHIFENAYDNFSVNTDRLLRYAGRKDKREYINTILKQINRQ